MNGLFLLLAEGDPQPQMDLAGILRGPMPMIVLMFLVIIVMSVRSSSRQRREQADMMAKLKKNDKVLTSSGIIGHIVQIKEDQTVTLKSGDDSNSRITVLRSTIVRIIDETVPPGTTVS